VEGGKRIFCAGGGGEGKYRIPLEELYRIRIKDVVCTI